MTNKIFAAATALLILATPGLAIEAVQTLNADRTGGPITVDGTQSEWAGIPSLTVPLKGRSKVVNVRMRAAIRDGRLYILAVWNDPEPQEMHKPLQWNEASQSYENIRQKEDRFAISWLMSGNFSHDKTGGAEFVADVWHWKAERSNKAGVAHDKWWKVSRTDFEGATAIEGDAGTVFVGRFSDAGDRLYSSTKPDTRQDDVMSRYVVAVNPIGSIGDVEARGVWRDGTWVLEMSRALDTGNDDDAVIPESGVIQFAVAAFDNKDGKKHSTSAVIHLNTDQ